MNDTTGKTSSCLAITEKKTHKHGGCVGIFFQLFDWNRRLAKKKLFSKKFLPPARAKQAAKKFIGDEKMSGSKHHLIANENSGGFPITKGSGNRSMDIEQKHEMRAPSLVARLMGLESIPAMHRDKPKKASFMETCDNGKKKFGGNHSESGREDMNLEMGMVRHESRPQKLQKTATCERKAVTRFGAEALQIRSVLSRARKHNHTKLASPLKSPRMSSGKNMSRSSRLIGAATKILEPGLQATSRAKCSLPYSRPIYSHKDDIVTEGSGAMSPDVMESTGYNASAAELLMGQTSCTSYGNLLDPVDCRPNVDEQPEFVPSITLNVVNASSLVSMQRKSMPHVPFHEERDKDSQRSQDQLISFVAQGTRKNNRQPRRKPLSHEGMAPWHLSSQPCWPHQKDESSPIAFKNRTQTQDQMLLGSDKILPRSKLSNLHTKRVSSAANAVGGTKDFVALNRSLSGRPRSRNATKIDNSMLDLERKSSHGQDNSLPEVRRVVRKRRTANISAHESTASISSTIVKERNIQCEALGGKKMSLSAPSTNHNSVKSKSGGQGEMDKVNENKVTDVISFTFNSPLKTKIGIPTDKEEKSMNKFSTHAQIPFPLTGDALGALLEQKLRELTCQEDEELAAGAPPKHSTALILQELISALTAEQSICLDRHNADMSFYNEVNNERLLGVSCDGNHFSPGSVLEASFSSSSLDESSGHVLHPDSMDFSCDHLQPLEPDVELSDSATSLNKGKRESMTDLANYIPRLLQIVNLSGDRYTRSKLTHTKDVILNATVQNLDGVHDLFIARFLLDELENIANAVWTYFKGIMGCDLLKKGSRLQGFLFDSVMEYLETKYCRYSNCGFSAWKNLHPCMKAEILVQEVEQEIKKWAAMAGMAPDEIIEWEMGHSLGKWTDFDVEAFEIGAGMDGEILQILVEEIAVELVHCRRSSL